MLSPHTGPSTRRPLLRPGAQKSPLNPKRLVAPRIACWRLRQLRLNGCGLVGTLPLALRDCSELQDLRLGSNDLDGELPGWLFDTQHLPKLRLVYLAFNRFSGKVPTTFSKSNIVEFLARGNELEGELSRCSENIKTLHLSGNKLSSLAKDCFESCSELYELNLSENQLECPFPKLPADCPNLGLRASLNPRRMDVLNASENVFSCRGRGLILF